MGEIFLSNIRSIFRKCKHPNIAAIYHAPNDNNIQDIAHIGQNTGSTNSIAPISFCFYETTVIFNKLNV